MPYKLKKAIIFSDKHSASSVVEEGVVDYIYMFRFSPRESLDKKAHTFFMKSLFHGFEWKFKYKKKKKKIK